MCDDSFDMEELDYDISQKTITAWSSQVAPKTRGRRTYSRRGSTMSTTATSNSNPMFDFPSLEEPLEESIECSSPPDDFRLGRASNIKPKIPGRRRFARAHTIDGATSSTNVRPNPPPLLKRSQSVTSTIMSSSPPLLRRSMSVSSRSSVTSFSQTSSSVSSSIGSIGDLENFDPNPDPLVDNATPKRGAKPCVDLRGRKKVRKARNFGRGGHAPLSLRPLSNSFSSLAQVGEGGLSWAKPPSSDTSPFPPRLPPINNDIDFTDFAESSPATSTVGSERKRAIWESPLEDFDDCMSVGGLSKSRSMSIDINANSLHGRINRHSDFSRESNGKKKREMDMQSDDDFDSGPESKDGMEDSGDDASIERGFKARSPMPTFVPYSQKYQRRVTTFDGAIFAVSETLNPETANADDVIDSMSSYQDLKFLIKKLKKESGGNRQSWHIAPPVAWATSRRGSFFHWATKSLGFTFRSGGMSVSYIQISNAKGTGILKLLESTLTVCKERGLGKTPTNACDNTQHFDFSDAKTPQGSKVLTMTPKEYVLLIMVFDLGYPLSRF